MRRLPAVPVYIGLEALAGFASMLTFTVTNVYYVREIGMSPLLLVLCGTAMELAIVLFELPTGILADTFGRRLSVIVSFAVMGTATILFGVLTAPAAIIGAYGLWGFGYTFQSGALQAWIVDEVGDDRMPRVLFRGGQAGWAAALAGVAASTAVGSFDLRAAIVAGGAGFLLLAALLAIVMPETGFRRPARGTAARAPLAAARGTARDGLALVRRTRILVLLAAIALLVGIWTESFDRLWQAHVVLDLERPVTLGLGTVGWIGLLTGVAFGLGVLTNEIGARRLAHVTAEQAARLLLALHGVLLVTALVFAMAGSFALAVVAYVLLTGIRSLVVPLGQVWANRVVTEPATRATVLSVVSQADALGQVAGGPAVGAIGTVVSLRAALTVGAVALAPAVVLYRVAARWQGREPAASAAVDR